MSGRNVNLTEHLNSFVDVQVSSGRHQNASEVVREALRRYEDALLAEQECVAAIREVIQEGRAAIALGDFTPIASAEDADALLGRLYSRYDSV
jgi:antitoxin ParD1/3/4